MNTQALFVILASIIASHPLFSQTWGWQMGGSWQDEITAIHVLEDGSLYAVGNFRGEIDIDPGPFVFVIGEALNVNHCGFVAHFASDGDLISANYLCGNNSNVLFKDVSFFDGKVYVGGEFDNGAGPSEDVLDPIVMNSNGGWDTFMLRLNAPLTTIEQHYSWGGVDGDFFGQLEVDDQGGIWVSAFTQSGVIDVGGIQTSGSGDADAGMGYVAKFISLSATSDVTEIGFTAQQITKPPVIAFLSNGELAVVYRGSVGLPFEIPALGLFTARFNASGSYIQGSVAVLISSTMAWVEDFTVDSNDNLLLLTRLNSGGSFTTFDVNHSGAEPVELQTSSELRLVVKYDSSLEHNWHNIIGANQWCTLTAVKTDNLNRVYVTGLFQSELAIGNQNLTGNGVNNEDFYLLVFNDEGGFLYADAYGMLGVDQVCDMQIMETGGNLTLYKGGIASLGGFFSTGNFNSIYGGETDMMLHVEPIDFLPNLIEGCTNPEACNFNPDASVDDNSCLLPDGCTDSVACNYDESAMCDDGSCVYSPVFSIVGVASPVQGVSYAFEIQGAVPDNATFFWFLSNPSLGAIDDPNDSNPIVTFTEDILGVGELCVEISHTVDGTSCATQACLGFEITVSVQEKFTDNLKVYPNPVTDVLTLQAQSRFTSGHYSLFNSVGRLVLKGTIRPNQNLIDMSLLSPGLYSLITLVDGQQFNQQIIKR